jgi:hypothetical protein
MRYASWEKNPFGHNFIPRIFLFFSAFGKPSQLVDLYALAVAMSLASTPLLP